MEAQWNAVWQVWMVFCPTEHGLFWTGETTTSLGSLRRRSIPVLGGPSLDATQTHLEEHWSRCGFCGAHNGTYYKPLEQHRPRCRWLGAADKFDAMRPNYFKMIDEDDPRFVAS